MTGKKEMNRFWKWPSNGYRACNIPCFHLVNIHKTHLHLTDEETEVHRSLGMVSAYERPSSKDRVEFQPWQALRLFLFPSDFVLQRECVSKKNFNVPSCSLKNNVSERYVWDECHAALWFSVSRFLAIPVPAGFAIIISRLGVKSKSVSQTVFYRNKYLWFS